MYVRSAPSCSDTRRAQDSAVAALQVELGCMNKENQRLRGCSRRSPSATRRSKLQRRVLCSRHGEEKRDGADLMRKENGVKWSIQLN